MYYNVIFSNIGSEKRKSIIFLFKLFIKIRLKFHVWPDNCHNQTLNGKFQKTFFFIKKKFTLAK
jgi:hypothetical protein